MEATRNYESKAGRRRGYLYACGTEAQLDDLIIHVSTKRQGIVWAVNMGGKLLVRWADISLGVRVPGTKSMVNLDVYNVRFIKRNARLSEEVAA